ncbi:hypothetical protein [Streptomyces sp. NPDC058155]|uniref:hypothetical protein n=1 Tax=Streptomyces sp. NPDC058155 TaxID=3346359 RepID=UPI0036EED4B1
MAQNERYRDSGDEDDYFEFGTPADIGTADGELVVKPVATAAGNPSSYSWRCAETSAPCSTDIPGSMDFPQYGNGRCEHGKRLTYQPRDRR